MDDRSDNCSMDCPTIESPSQMHSGHEPVLHAGDEAHPPVEPPAQVIEALLFASDAPLSPVRLAALAGDGLTPGRVGAYVDSLNDKYAQAGLTFCIERIANGYQMMTVPQYRPWLARLNRHRRETRLSPAALETLAVIAYKQPIIRADVEAVRGVACSDVIQRLREMDLVRVVGRAEVVGRPMLYGTTRKFLDLFGLGGLKDLPPLEAGLKPVGESSPGPEAAPSETAFSIPAEEEQQRRAAAGA